MLPDHAQDPPTLENELTVRLTAQNIADKKYFSSTGGNVIAQGPPRIVKLSLDTRF